MNTHFTGWTWQALLVCDQVLKLQYESTLLRTSLYKLPVTLPDLDYQALLILS
jgi:hypothetical protein